MTSQDDPGVGNAYAEGHSPFRPAAPEPLLQRTIPVSADVLRYRQHTFRRDLLAGLTVAALAIPSAMGYAEVVGLEPVAGLYALLLPVIAYALLGSSRRLMIGPEGATAAMAGVAIAPIVADDPGSAAGAAAALTLFVGVFYLLARVLRLGWIADYFSRPVLIGYIHGVVVVLIIGQIGKLLGLSIEADNPLPQLQEIAGDIGDISWNTAVVGFLSLAALFGLRFFMPRLPAALIVVVAAIAASAAFSFDEHGIATVGPIPAGLPSIKLPPINADQLGQLIPAALGIFAVSFADSILTARSFAGRHHEHVRANQELVAFGAASLAASVTQGFPVSSSGSRTAVADQMGVRTQLAALYAAVAVAVVLLWLTKPIEYLPTATLGAVIVFGCFGLIDLVAWRGLAHTSRRETGIAVITFLGVIIIGVLPALIVAVALSIVDAVTRSARPHDAVLGYVPRLGRWADVSVNPGAQIEPGIVVYRLDDRLFFANADYVKGRIREAIAGAPGTIRWVVFDAESVTTIDSTGIEALKQIAEGLQREGIGFAISRAHGAMLTKLQESGEFDVEADFYPTTAAAVEACRGREGPRSNGAPSSPSDGPREAGE